MPMLIFETFLLMLGSTVLGAAIGHLLWEAFGSRLEANPSDRPWLRDLGSLPQTPVLPAAPTLIDAAERARLAAIASALPGTVAPAAASSAAAPAPVATTVEPAAAAATMPPIAADAAERAAAADAVGTRPVGLLGADAGVPDDLERIKGIGPVNAKRLHELGIWHFAQIAAWTPENVAWVGSFLAFPGRIEREHWVDQAKGFIAEKQ